MLILGIIVTWSTFNQVLCVSTDKVPLTKTPWGLVIGKSIKVDLLHRVDAFLGIPYALPPVGPLRFEETLPLPDYPFHPIKHHFTHLNHHSLKTIKADSFKAACIQQPFFYQVHAGNVSLSENCLYLNIFKPSVRSQNGATTLYPVFIFIHGSAFAFGGPASTHNQAQFLAAYGEIIVVTVTHRLSLFGQAYDGSTNTDSHFHGNQYLHDIIQSLYWVHDNIQHFGGDPSQVTLGGLSAGAIMSTAVFVSPLVPDGLFNKVVAMSGLSIYPPTVLPPSVVKKSTEETLRSVNCLSPSRANKTLDEPFNWYEISCIKHVDPIKLILNEADILYYPVFGDTVLPEPPQKLINQYIRKNYSLLIGTEQTEDVVSKYSPRTIDDAINWLKNRYKKQIEIGSTEKLSKLINLYFDELNDEQKSNSTMVEATFHQIISDFAFICPSLLLGKIFSFNNRVNFYRNHYILEPDKNSRPYGTFHADDAILFLGHPFVVPELYSDSDRKVSLQMMKLLGSFVRGSSLPWPEVSKEGGKVIPYVWKITDPVDYRNFETDSFSNRCSLWASIYPIDDV